MRKDSRNSNHHQHHHIKQSKYGQTISFDGLWTIDINQKVHKLKQKLYNRVIGIRRISTISSELSSTKYKDINERSMNKAAYKRPWDS